MFVVRGREERRGRRERIKFPDPKRDELGMFDSQPLSRRSRGEQGKEKTKKQKYRRNG